MLRVRFLIGVVVSGLWLTACTTPPPKVTQPTVSSQPLPTVSPQPLPTFTSNVAYSAWQVWHVSAAPNSVFSVATQADRLWVGTAYGAWQFDLKAKRIVRHDEQLGFVHLLMSIENGQVWANTSKGLFFFDGQEWHDIQLPGSSSAGLYHYYTSFAIDAEDNLWLETSSNRGGIYSARYRGHIPTGEAMELAPGTSDYPMVDSHNCQQWPMMVRTYGQSHRSTAECRALQAASQTLSPAPYASARLALDADGSIWRVDLNDDSVSHWSNGVPAPVDLPAGTRVYALAPDLTRGVWIGTDRGLVYAAGTELRWLPALDQYFTDGLPIDLAIEPSGAVWVLTVEFKLSWLPADHLPARFNSITGVNARSIAAAPDGLWITHGTDLIRLKLGEPPTTVVSLPKVDECQLLHVTSDQAGAVWATTRCGAAWQYQPTTSRWTRHVLTDPASRGAKFDPIQTIVASADGTVYAVGLSGLGELTEVGEVITPTTEPSEATLPNITYQHRALFPDGNSLAQDSNILVESQSAADRQGGIWIAIINRPELWHYAKGQVTTLPHPLRGEWVTGLHVDQRGWLWEVGNDQQLAVYAGQAWRTLAMPDIGTVRRIADDPDGRLWFVGDRGIAVYDPAADKRP